VLPTSYIAFTRPGSYVVVFVHLLQGVPSGIYSVNMTYTDSVHQMYPGEMWTWIVYYYDVE